MGKWTYEFIGDSRNEAWVLLDPDGNQRDEHWYNTRAEADFAIEILNRHAPGQEYVTVCFTVKADSSIMSALSILENGYVELNPDSLSMLYNQTLIGNSVFGVAEVGCPDWAERAGADPSLWED